MGFSYYDLAVKNPAGASGDVGLKRRLDDGTADETDLANVYGEIADAMCNRNGKSLGGTRGEYPFSGVADALMHLCSYYMDGATTAPMGDPDALKRKCHAPNYGASSGRGGNRKQDRLIIVRMCLERAAAAHPKLKSMGPDAMAWATLVRFGYVSQGKQLSAEDVTELVSERWGGIYFQKEIAAMTSRIARDLREELQERELIGPQTRSGMEGFDLQGWKAIKCHLDKYVERGVEYWQRLAKRDESMPVHTFLGTRCARASDIDKWAMSQLTSGGAPGEHP